VELLVDLAKEDFLYSRKTPSLSGFSLVGGCSRGFLIAWMMTAVCFLEMPIGLHGATSPETTIFNE
jgi:hypothetical protein